MTDEVKIIQTDEGAKDGQNKCPKCGSSDIQPNIKTGKLRCSFCRHEFDPVKVEEDYNISDLEGMTIGSGIQDIQEDTKDVVTLKCESCGAEVVIDTASSTQARCHWCRNTLSINQQIPNGAVPDMILPFQVSKNEAQKYIADFVQKRKFFAHPTFTKEFTTENILGVYFPYMIVDINGNMSLSGHGEEQIRQYSVGSGDDKKTLYDADLYYIERDFDITIDDLTIEASGDKLNYSSSEKTSNIINSIMPFDTENCVKYDSNYLRGFTSEKRDININQIKQIVEAQSSDVARIAANSSLKKYDRGVAWSRESFQVKGESWKGSYLPVWVYSYMQKKGGKNLLHYVAVNARTRETMGSVPINMKKLWLFSILVEIFGVFMAIFISRIETDSDYGWIFLLSGVGFFLFMYLRYRNSDARHTYENETKYEISNMEKVDQFVEHRNRLRNSSMNGANNFQLKGNKIDFRQDEVVKRAERQGVDVEEIQKKKSEFDKKE